MKNRKKFWQIVALFIFLFVIILSAILFFSRKIVINQFKTELDWSSQITLSAINPNRVYNSSMLIGDRGAILKNEDVSWLKGEVERLGDIFLRRGVDALYILVKKGSNIYFIVESTPVGEDLYVEPGSLYKFPPIEVFTVFSGERAIFTDLYTDEYGTYFSKFTPIFDDYGNIVGVLGADIDYPLFKNKLFFTRIVLILLSILVFTVAFLVIYYLRKKEEITKEAEENDKKIKMILNSIPNGIIVYDEKESISLWNKASQELFGLKEEKAINKKVSEIVEYKKVLDEKGNEVKGFQFFSKNNISLKRVEFYMKNNNKIYEAIYDYLELNDRSYVVALFEDITFKKIEQSELEIQKNKLEKLNSLMVDRELKMIELKNEITKLKGEGE